MGGFLSSIVKLGATGAATAAGGPLAGAAMSAGLGMANSALHGGNLGDMLMNGATNAGGSFINGQLAPNPSSSLPTVPNLAHDFSNTINQPLQQQSPLLNALKFNY